MERERERGWKQQLQANHAKPQSRMRDKLAEASILTIATATITKHA